MSDIKISRTQKALRLIQDEGITAKEAAERVGITSAAVSKGKHHTSKTQQKIRMFSEMQEEIESLRQQLAISEAEGLEQARLLGMSGEREAELRAEIERLKRDQNQLARKEAQKMLDNGTGGYYESQIIALRQQLAEKDAEIEQWKANSRENKLIAEECVRREQELRQQLSASQAREQQLREALRKIADLRNLGKIEPEVVAFEALTLQQDTTALSAMIAKAGEVMRERSKRACEKRAEDRFNECGTREDDTGACYYSGRHGEVLSAMDEEDDDCANAIRALPGVTLEDLK